MLIYRYVCFHAKHNSYFLLGVVFGLLISLNYFRGEDETTAPCPAIVTDGYEPHLVAQPLGDVRKPSKSKSVLRPRYYSTELGIREKLFVGVMTSEKDVARAIAINKTLAHHAQKIKFFMTAKEVVRDEDLGLPNAVGFTDTRETLRPFHVLKYICDNFYDDFDFYYLTSDVGYVDGGKLLRLVGGISVSEDVYMGTAPEADSHYCTLDAGFLVSNSVIKKIRDNLDWCVRNAYSTESYENIGRCIIHSANVKCVNSVQDHHLNSFRLPSSWNLNTDLKDFVHNDEFNNAVSVYPITKNSDFYSLQLYFARLHLESLNKDIAVLSKFVSVNSAESNWPAGLRNDPTLPPRRPPDRFHQPKYSMINLTHHFMPDDFNNIAEHSDAEKRDINNVLSAVVSKVRNEYPDLKYSHLLNGYRKYNPTLGINYIFDMEFIDVKNNEQSVNKRYEVFKPLGKATVLSVPYVTENTRIILILPVWQFELSAGEEFLKSFETSFLERKDKFFVLMVLIYPAEAASRGLEDIFGTLKTKALDLSEKYKADGLKVVWLSIRLPASPSLLDETGLIEISTLDLALKKVPLDSLVLVGRPKMEIKTEFLNRVRMNTISGFQVFSPIGFQKFHSYLSAGPIPSKTSGRFAPWDYSVLSFYSRDYVIVRKSIVDKIPIVYSDKDIEVLLGKGNNNVTSVYEMFVKYSSDVHIFRAVEPGLLYKYDDVQICPPRDSYKNSSLSDPDVEYSVDFGETSLNEKCINNLASNNFKELVLGGRTQLAKLIFER